MTFPLRRSPLLLVLGLCAALLLAACGGDEVTAPEPQPTATATAGDPEPDPAGEEAEEPEETEEADAPPERATVRVALDFVPNTNHAGIFVADDLGYFEDENLELVVVPWAFTVTGVLVANGDADLGVAYPSDTIQERAKDQGVKIVASIIQENNAALVVLEDAPYESPADLAGLRYGGYGTPHEVPIVTEVIRNAGADDPTFTPVVLQAGAIEALTGEQVEFSAVYEGWSEIAAELGGTTLRLYPYDDYLEGEHQHPDVIFVATDEAIAERGDVLRRALRALGRGYTYAAENPDDTARILTESVEDLAQSAELVERSAEFRAGQYLDANGTWGCNQEDKLTGLAGLLERTGVIVDANEQPLPAPAFDEFATNELLDGCS